jgi:hypothetical protein
MDKSTESVSTAEFALGLGSFVPVLGIFLGLPAVILGALKVKKGGMRLILLGAFGPLFGMLFCYYAISHALLSLSRKQLVVKDLGVTLIAVEFYKQVHGVYPKRLDDLVRASCSYLYDGSAGFSGTLHHKFHQYELLPDGQHYTLSDTGPDGVSGTADDVYPILLTDEVEHVGYVKR